MIYLSRIARFSQFAATRCGPMPIHQDVIDSGMLPAAGRSSGEFALLP